MKIARVWRLEPGEDVLEIEKQYEFESRMNLPLQLRGRVLDDAEILDSINVSINDILLYEVQSQPMLSKNSYFAFTPKPKHERKMNNPKKLNFG